MQSPDYDAVAAELGYRVIQWYPDEWMFLHNNPGTDEATRHWAAECYNHLRWKPIPQAEFDQWAQALEGKGIELSDREKTRKQNRIVYTENEYFEYSRRTLEMLRLVKKLVEELERETWVGTAYMLTNGMI